jgi:hypothetical protein
MWDVVGKISTGFALLAFIAAVVAGLYRASIKGQIGTLKALPPADRVQVVTQTLNTFGIKAENLTREQSYNLALQELSIKDQRFKVLALVVVVLALIFAAIAAYTVYNRDTNGKQASSVIPNDALPAIVASATKDWRGLVESHQQTIRNLERQHHLTELQLRTFLIQVGRNPGVATGDELAARLDALVRELREGKVTLSRVETITAGSADPQVKMLREQAETAAAQGNLDLLNKSLNGLTWRWAVGTEKVIPVCWERSADQYEADRRLVQDAIRSSWEKSSDIKFTGWQACREQQLGIRIGIADESPHTLLGTSIDGRSRGMTLNFTFKNWNPGCSSSPQQRQLCIKAMAVHEFGHALGFTHEHERPDTPVPCRNRFPPAWASTAIHSALLRSYDPHSVMNYCNPIWLNGGELSDGDKTAVRLVYGFRAGEAPSAGVAAQPLIQSPPAAPPAAMPKSQ